MLSRLAEAIGKPLTEQVPTFNDNSSVSSWAFNAVGQMQATGIMGGVGNNTFSPSSDYTREQSIITIMRLYAIVNSSKPNTGITPTSSPAPSTTPPFIDQETWQREFWETYEFKDLSCEKELREYATSLGYAVSDWLGAVVGYVPGYCLEFTKGNCVIRLYVAPLSENTREDTIAHVVAETDEPWPTRLIVQKVQQVKDILARFA